MATERANENEEFALRWTHRGEFLGVEPTGEQVEVGVTTFQRVENGTAVEERQIVDTLGMLQQLGVVELPVE